MFDDTSVVRGIRFPTDIDKEISNLAKSQERDISSQIRWMCIEYMRLVKDGSIEIPQLRSAS